MSEGRPTGLRSVASTVRVEACAEARGGARRSGELRTLDDLPGPRGWPLLGNLPHLEVARAHTILSRWASEFGPFYRFRVAHRNAVAIADPDLINEVLRDRPVRFRRISLIKDAILDLGVEGVFTAEGTSWRRQRKLAMHALNTEHLRAFFDRLEQVTARLQRRWERAAESGARIDAQGDLMRFTIDVTSGLAFGTDLNTLETEGDIIQQHLDKVFPALARRIFAPFPYWRWFRLPADRKVDAAMRRVLALVNELVTGARARVANAPQGTKPGNFLDAMVMAQSDDAAAFTDAELVGNTLTMLLAGEDTTANSLAWLMHLMVEHPDVQARMREEADRVLRSAPRPPDYASTEALRYIEAAAHEAMRVLPVAPLQGAEPNEDTVIGDVRVPRGTPIYLLTAHIATSTANFRDGQAFRPERWLEAGGRSAIGHNLHAFLPFGAGPRFCPGRHLAMLEIKMVAAMLCRNFEVGRYPSAPPPEQLFSFTMMPRNLFVMLKRRGTPPA
ncbi:MAG TPA: cytochrome P450 [Casimicrobiaceae bacterium]|nr:cytochrome P450 [Casimicrobiaceae bacterium]